MAEPARLLSSSQNLARELPRQDREHRDDLRQHAAYDLAASTASVPDQAGPRLSCHPDRSDSYRRLGTACLLKAVLSVSSFSARDPQPNRSRPSERTSRRAGVSRVIRCRAARRKQGTTCLPRTRSGPLWSSFGPGSPAAAPERVIVIDVVHEGVEVRGHVALVGNGVSFVCQGISTIPCRQDVSDIVFSIGGCRVVLAADAHVRFGHVIGILRSRPRVVRMRRSHRLPLRDAPVW